MPIRTQHGRAAVWRRIWGWPLTSGRHAAATAAAGTVVVLAIGAAVGVSGGSGSPAAHRTPNPAIAPSYELPETSTYELPETSVVLPPSAPEAAPLPPPESAEAPPEAIMAAERFAAAFARPAAGTSPQQWLDGLRAQMTPESAGLIGTIDPTNVDVTRRTGPATVTRSTRSLVETDVPTDAGALHVVLLRTGPDWKVRSYTTGGS